ncbi:MAG: DUF1573 domain-containing protein [Bacteroidota bacterium]
MKNQFILFAILCFIGVSLPGIAQDGKEVKETTAKQPVTDKGQITFETPAHDFGDLKQGERVSYTFKFKNTGKLPFMIYNVQTTCGCTAPEWPANPVGPGKSGQIVVNFNSAGKSGRQNKVCTILSNAANNREPITIMCNVLAPKNDGTVPVQSEKDKEKK